MKKQFFGLFTVIFAAMFAMAFTGCKGPNDDPGGGSAPSAPTGVTAMTASSGSITISWSPVSGADGYNIYRSLSYSGTYNMVGTVNSTTFTDTGLLANTAYYYKVAAYNSIGASEQSSSVSATTSGSNGATLSVPANVTATAVSSSSITVSWSVVSGANGYLIYRSLSYSGIYDEVGDAYSTSFTDTGLSANTAYYYKVSAFNNYTETAQSSPVSATTSAGNTPPSAPSNVTATATSPGSITVSWSVVSGATGYYIYRSLNYSGPYDNIGTSYSASYTDTGLSANTNYHYRVAAYNNYGVGAQSSTIASVITSGSAPDTPTDVTATVESSSTITVSWSAVSGADGYNIYRSTSPYGFSQIGTSTATSYTDTDLSGSTTYYYTVSAYTDNYGEGEQSSYASATTVPDTPTNVTATATSQSIITVTWSPVSVSGGYYIYRSSSYSGTYDLIGSTYSYHQNYSDSGLSANTTYYYIVSAYNSNGMEGEKSSSVSATTAPDTPTNVTATLASFTSITVSWSVVSGADGYNIYRSTNPYDSYSQIGTSTSTSYTDTGLSANTFYYYIVVAHNNNGESEQSIYAWVNTPAVETVSPDRIEYYWVNEHDDLATTSGYAVTVMPDTTLYITAQGTGYSGHKWYLNGVDTGESGNSYTFSSTAAGKHTVSLLVEKNGRLYNTNIVIMVAVSVTVTFDANGGSGTVSSQSVSPGSSITLPGGSGMTMSGYTFNGWNTNSSGTGTNYNAGESYWPTGNVTLYAKWSTHSTVTFNTNGASGAVSAQTVSPGSSITLPGGSGMTMSGYTFRGWNTNSSGTGTNYNAGTSYTPTGDITLYARWAIPRVVTVSMYDSYGDGWNGASLTIYVNGSSFTSGTVNNGSSSSFNFTAAVGDSVSIYWVSGSYNYECSFIVYYADTPPSPAFTSNNNNSWNGSNALVYRLRTTSGTTGSNYLTGVSTGTLLGSFTVQ